MSAEKLDGFHCRQGRLLRVAAYADCGQIVPVGVGVGDLEIACIAREIDLYAGTTQLAALDMNRKQTTIRKSSMHQQFVWRCRLDLFSCLLNGDLWKLIGGERREAGR